MDRFGVSVVIWIVAVFLTACGPGLPAPRLNSYLNSRASDPSVVEPRTISASPVALVVVIADQKQGEESALSPQGLEFVRRQARARVEEAVPIHVGAVVPDEEVIATRDGRLPLTTLAETRQVEWLAVVVLSAIELQEPQPFAMDGNRAGGGAMGTLPGTVTSVYALAEMALVDGRSGRSPWRSEGRSVVTLEQLANGLESNAFPSIYRQGGQQRIAAPRNPVEAQDAVRSLAYEEALYQAAHALQQSWKESLSKQPHGTL
ncbi:hypothetical protein YTPLAS18_27990 [Nitrospira sp.]|nr:hypothetical protein YTPLAS18_27990 [Nitrospira sp.]